MNLPMTQQKPELQRSFKPASLGTNEEEVVQDPEDDIAADQLQRQKIAHNQLNLSNRGEKSSSAS